MEAFARSLDVVLKERQQWVVPVYQRHYSWKSDEDEHVLKSLLTAFLNAFRIAVIQLDKTVKS